MPVTVSPILDDAAMAAAPSLSAEQVAQFERDGFLGPFELCSATEMQAQHAAIDAAIAAGSPQGHNHLHGKQENPGHNRHQDNRVIYDISTNPAIIGRMASIMGPDLQMWRTNFFTKEPGGREIPWHQDWNYWPLDPMAVVSAWIAIDDVDAENSAPNFIPGSHKQPVPHVQAPERMQFGEMADPTKFDSSAKRQMIMRAGQFVLFNERTLHQSDVNSSQRRRMGLAVRVIPPTTRITTYDTDEHGVMQICGHDTIGQNRFVERPS